MSDRTATPAMPSHPSQHRDRVSVTALLFGLFGAPAAWTVQFMVNYGVVSEACFPRIVPRVEPAAGWQGISTLEMVVNGIAILVGIAATLVAWRSWRKTQQEESGGAGHLLEVGEGRSRFLSVCGIMTGTGFLLVILANSFVYFLVPTCAG